MDREEEEVYLPKGHVINGCKGKYIIEKLLGEGGFGAVYRVCEESDPSKLHAMKVERRNKYRIDDSKLKMEIAILKLVGSERQNKSHFTAIVDRGKKETYFFLVMQLVGKSLADLKSKRPEKVFTPCTALSVSGQCLEAVQDLHKYGFLHRDLKPANYAPGLDDKKRVIYILDFGIARKYTNSTGVMKTPRVKALFKGTVKFSSIACHRNIDQAPKDDCESWFYLLIDVIQPMGLPWKRIPRRDDVLYCKEECRRGEKKAKFFENLKCVKELSKILDYLDKLQYYDRIDHDFIQKCLSLACITEGGTMEDPYDWEKEDESEKKEKDEKKDTKKDENKEDYVRVG